MKPLFPHQQDAILHLAALLAEGHRYLSLVGNTGSGKTLLTTTLLAYLTKVRSFGVRVVVVIVPDQNIAANYRQQGRVRFGSVSDPDGVTTFPDVDLNEVVDTMPPTRKLLRKHLSSNNKHAAVMVVTYSLALKVFEDFDDLSDVMVVFDECHRTSDSGRGAWSKTRHVVQERGAVVLGVSGTMFRSDGTAVFEDSESHEIPLDELIENKLCPSKFPIRTVLLDWDAQSVAEMFDDSLEGEPSQLASLLTPDNFRQGFRDWVASGCPKAMFKFPLRSMAEKARDLFREEFASLPKVVERYGRPVEPFQAWGEAKKVQQHISGALDHERNVTRYEDSKVDLIFFCQRGQEGLDWPLCSHVYTFGLVYSPKSVLQLLGRGMRSKQFPDGTPRVEGYPEEYLDYCCLTMFAPVLSPKAEEELLTRNRFKERMALLTALLANHNNAKLLALDTELRKAIRTTVGPVTACRGTGGDGGNISRHMKASLWLAKIETSLGRPLGLGDVSLLVDRANEVPKGVFKAALLKLLAELPDEERHTVIEQTVKDTFRDGELVDEAWVSALANALSAMCEEFPDLTVSFRDPLGESYGLLTRTEGDTVKKLSKALWSHIIFRPPSFWALAHAVHTVEGERRSRKMSVDLSAHFGLAEGTYAKRHADYQLRHDRFTDQPEDVSSMAGLEEFLRCQTL